MFLLVMVCVIFVRKVVKLVWVLLDKFRLVMGIFIVMDVIFIMWLNFFVVIELIICCIRLIGVSIFIFILLIMVFLLSW